MIELLSRKENGIFKSGSPTNKKIGIPGRVVADRKWQPKNCSRLHGNAFSSHTDRLTDRQAYENVIGKAELHVTYLQRDKGLQTHFVLRAGSTNSSAADNIKMVLYPLKKHVLFV